MDSPKFTRIIILIILFLAFAGRFTGVGFGYPLLTQNDEGPEIVYPAFVTLDFHQSRGIAPITHNGPICKYMLALVLGIWGAIGSLFVPLNFILELWRSTTAAYIAGRIAIGVLPGVATVWILYRVGRRFGGEFVGLAAAFFMAVAFKAVEFSHYATSDTTATLFVALVLLFSLRYSDGLRKRDLYLSGILWAFGVATKASVAPALVIPLLAAILVKPSEPSHRLRILLNVALLSFISVIILHFPYLFQLSEFIQKQIDTFTLHIRFYEKGFFWYFRPDIFPTNEIPSAGIGWTLLSVCLLGMVISFFRSGVKKWIVLAFPLIFYLSLAFSSIKFSRYILPMIPFLCLWGASFVSWLEEKTSECWKGRGRYALVILIGLLIASPNMYHSFLFDLQAADGNSELEMYLASPEIFGEGTKWTSYRLHSGSIKPELRKDFVRLDYIRSFKNIADERRIGKLKAAVPGILSKVVDPGFVERDSTLDNDSDSPPGVFLSKKNIQFFVLNREWADDFKEIPQKYMRNSKDSQNLRSLLNHVKENWELVATFEPRYRQTWGEGFAGRQPTLDIFHKPDE